ncbi:MAG: hypothetical protein GW892_03095 [Armatimonadetes bacterium]|nr:hypothetical protein [Armatimonadota bacterium]
MSFSLEVHDMHSKQYRSDATSPWWTLAAFLLLSRLATAQPPVQPEPIDPAKGVRVVLGAENEEHGLRQIDWEPEHKSRVATVGGRECRATDKANKQYYLDFNVDDRYLFNTDHPVQVAVEYFDEGRSFLVLKYDSNDPTAPDRGRSKFSEYVYRQSTRVWKTHVFRLPDARFANAAIGGNDFVLTSEAYVAGRDDLCVAAISVLIGGMQISVSPPAVSADGQTSCQVDALVTGPLGPVEDGTQGTFATDAGTVTPSAEARGGKATARFVGAAQPGEATITVRCGDEAERAVVPMLSGSGEVLDGKLVVLSFGDASGVAVTATTPGTTQSFAAPGTEARDGRPAARLDYQFTEPHEKRPQIHIRRLKPLPGLPRKIGLWVHGDNSWTQLHAWLLDATGQVHNYCLGYLNFTGWKLLEQPLGAPLWHTGGKDDGVLHPPIRFLELLIAPNYSMPEAKRRGAIHLQDLTMDTLVPVSESLVVEAALAPPKEALTTGAPIDCRVRVCNLAPERRVAKLRWQVLNEAQTVLTEEQEEVEIEGHAAAPETVRLPLPGAGKYTAKFVGETEGVRAEATLAVAVP